MFIDGIRRLTRTTKSNRTIPTRLAVAIGLVVLAAVMAWNLFGENPPAHSTVVHSVVDGDTLSVRVNGQPERVRLIGVDTPETVDPNRPAGCFGPEASRFTKSLLPPRTPIRIELDSEPRDRFGRLLGYVYRLNDDLFINAELVRSGHAQLLTIPPNVAHTNDFALLAAEARENNRGLWSACPVDP